MLICRHSVCVMVWNVMQVKVREDFWRLTVFCFLDFCISGIDRRMKS